MVNFPSANSNSAYSWREAKRLAREQGYGEKIELPKRSSPVLPPEFEQSRLSIRGSANAVYRDQRKTDSYQVREYDNKWTIELDRHNPETGNAVAHAITDAPGYTLALVIGAAVFGASGA